MKRINILLLSLSICSASIALPTHQKDPCDSISGTWKGELVDKNKKCTCKTTYKISQYNDNAAFRLSFYACSLDCDVPPSFSGTCRGAQFTSDFDGGFSGLVFEDMVELENSNYALKLSK